MRSDRPAVGPTNGPTFGLTVRWAVGRVERWAKRRAFGRANGPVVGLTNGSAFALWAERVTVGRAKR